MISPTKLNENQFLSSYGEFNYLKGNCPRCNGDSKSCRQNSRTGIIHCRSPIENPDYLYIGEDAIGFSMWQHIEDRAQFREQKNQEFREERLRQQEARLQELAARAVASLVPEERDREIRKILKQLSLDKKHKEQLRQRGLTDEQIDAAGYRTVEQWQKLSQPIDERLAGIKLGGLSMLNHARGVLCPIKDIDGYFVGFQIRFDNVVEGEPRYKWLAGDKKINPKPSSHLPNGELPLAFFGQPNEEGIVGLAEGTAFKPYLANLRLGIPVIGAAGGNWASSPETLKEGLKGLNAKKIILYADAGALSNKNVLSSYQKTIKLVTDEGYLVEIGWWGQFSKSNGDIDEISQGVIAQIEHITTEKFFSLSNVTGKNPEPKTTQKHNNGLYFSKITLEQWQVIATTNGLDLPDWVTINSDFTSDVTVEFWEWVKCNPLPVFLTIKEATANDLINLGYCCIGINKLYGAIKQEWNSLGERIGQPTLNPKLISYTQNNREFIICFDNGHNLKNERYQHLHKRFMAINQLGFILEQTHKSSVKVIEDFKDSYIFNCLKLNLDIELNKIDLNRYRYNWTTDINNLDDVVKQNSQYFSIEGYEEKIEKANLLCFIGNQGTGKTVAISKFIKEEQEKGNDCYSLTHRIQLGLSQGDVIGIPYIETPDGDFSYGFIACVDSVHPKGRAYIDSSQVNGSHILIDENEQVFNHVLNSKTCETERIGILNHLEEIIKQTINTGGKIIISDANLKPTSLLFIEQLAGKQLDKFILHNTYLPKLESQLTYIEDPDPDSIIMELDRQIKEDKKCFVFCSSQKIKSRRGTTNLGSTITNKYPDKKILVCDSETVANPEHPAYGITTRLNDLKNYDIVLVSSVFETGISIVFKDENGDKLEHFDSVFVIANGMLPAHTIIQASQRVRGNVPVYIWCQNFSNVRIGNGSTYPNQLLKSTTKNVSDSVNLLGKMADDFTGSNPFLDQYAEIACCLNYEYANYKQIILEGFEKLGYSINTKKFEDTEKIEELTATMTNLAQQKKVLIKEQANKIEKLKKVNQTLKQTTDEIGLTKKEEELTDINRELRIAKSVNNQELILHLKVIRKDLLREIEFRKNNSQVQLLIKDKSHLKQAKQLLKQKKNEAGLPAKWEEVTEINRELKIAEKTNNQDLIESLTSVKKDLLREIKFRTNNSQVQLLKIDKVLEKHESIKNLTEVINETTKSLDDIDSEITEVGTERQTIKDELTETAKKNYEAHLKEVLESEDISDLTYQILRNKKELTKRERLSLKKATIKDLYKLPSITEELIRLHDDGIYPIWRLHYFLTVGRDTLQERDEHKLKSLTYQHKGNSLLPFLPDIESGLLSNKINLLEQLDLTQFLNNPEREYSNDSLDEWANKASQNLYSFNRVFRTQISSELHPIKLAQAFLKIIGNKLECTRRTKKERFYTLAKPTDGRDVIFTNWKAAQILEKQVQEQKEKNKRERAGKMYQEDENCQKRMGDKFPNIYIDIGVTNEKIEKNNLSPLCNIEIQTTTTSLNKPDNNTQSREVNGGSIIINSTPSAEPMATTTIPAPLTEPVATTADIPIGLKPAKFTSMATWVKLATGRMARVISRLGGTVEHFLLDDDDCWVTTDKIVEFFVE